MSTKKFTVPNWSQSVLAREVGLNPKNVSVEHEDDRTISFVQYHPHCSVLVGKIDGTTIVRKDERYGRANV